MWKWVGVNVEGIIGVPARDLTDEEFVTYNAKVNAQHSADQRGALERSGLYEHVEEKKSNTKAKAEVEETATSANTSSANTAVVTSEDKKDD